MPSLCPLWWKCSFSNLGRYCMWAAFPCVWIQRVKKGKALSAGCFLVCRCSSRNWWGQFLSPELTAPGWARGQCASSGLSQPVGEIQPWHNKLGRICSARKEILVRFVMLLTVRLSWLAIYLERFVSWLPPLYSKKTHLWRWRWYSYA